MRAHVVFVLTGIMGAVGLLSPAWAVNRFVVNNQSLAAGSTGNNVPVLADLDQDIFAFSVHIGFDASKLRVTLVQVGSAVAAVSPEYSQGTVTNGPGDIVYGVVFDTSDPITKKLTAGAGKEVLKMTVDVLAASGSAVLDLVNVPGNPSRLNVMADLNGNPAPSLTLVDGTLSFTVSNPPPVIQSFSDNSGQAGKQFLVVGLNFNQPGLAVTVCGKAATFTLLGDNQTIRVTAPVCADGPAEVKVCTNFGCASDPAGFTYGGGRPSSAGTPTTTRRSTSRMRSPSSTSSLSRASIRLPAGMRSTRMTPARWTSPTPFTFSSSSSSAGRT